MMEPRPGAMITIVVSFHGPPRTRFTDPWIRLTTPRIRLTTPRIRLTGPWIGLTDRRVSFHGPWIGLTDRRVSFHGPQHSSHERYPGTSRETNPVGLVRRIYWPRRPWPRPTPPPDGRCDCCSTWVPVSLALRKSDSVPM